MPSKPPPVPRAALPIPGQVSTMTTADLRVLLLETAQPTFYNGKGYRIVSKHIGPGVYEVWLREWEHDGREKGWGGYE